MTVQGNPPLLGPVVGGLDADRVRIWFRAPDPQQWWARVIPLEGSREEQRVTPWLPPTAQATHALFRVMGLRPDTPYRYALYRQGETVPRAQGSFRTAPLLGTARDFQLLLAGTFLPHGRKGVNPQALGTEPGQARLLILPGHWVVADAVGFNGLSRFPQRPQEYARLYHQALEAPGWREVLAHTPVLSMWGHRSVDWGWAWADVDRTAGWLPPRVRWWRWLQRYGPESRTLTRQQIVAALQTYWEHLGQLNPPLLAPPVGTEDLGRPLLLTADRGHLGYTFAYGATAFLALDVHAHRVQGGWAARWLHPEQWRTLEGWLASVQRAYPLKIVISPAAVFARGPGDFWDAYRNALRRLLHILVARGVHGVLFLSHGLEWGWMVEARLAAEGRRVTVWELGVGAMSLPAYPRGLWRPRAWVRLPLIEQLQPHIPFVPPPHVAEVTVQWRGGPHLEVRFLNGRQTLAAYRWTLEGQG